jgi:hypothetical protein
VGGRPSRHDGEVRGRRTAAVLLLCAALATGCRDDQDTDHDSGLPEPTAAPSLGGSVQRLRAPQLVGDLEVRVVRGVRVSGLGCRQRTAYDACSLDGTKTYTWRGDGTPGTVRSARMVPDVGFGTWIVLVRFQAADRAAVQAVADRAGGAGGFALVLDSHSGSALQAVAPIDVEGGRITVRDLRKPEARRLVGGYVIANTGR